MSLPARIATSNVAVTIVSGPDTGSSFLLAGKKITIGRQEGNDIVLNDPKCSREHAIIEMTANGIRIRDTGSQRGFLLNGEPTRMAYLEPGQVVTIGSTSFRLGTVAPSSLPMAQPLSVAPTPQPASAPASMGYATTGATAFTAKKKPPVLLIGLALIVVVGALLNQGEKAKPKVPETSVSKKADVEIELTNKRLDDLIRERNTQERDSITYKDAESAFIEGYRDFREGNYKRARDAFSAAASLNPNHKFATRYQSLASQRLEQSITQAMTAAQIHTERNQFKQALAAYKRVMFLTDDVNDKRFQEAKIKVEELDIILKGNF